MKRIDQIKQIGGAVASKVAGTIPTEEVWYQQRNEICNGCEYNTKNIPLEQQSFLDKRLCGSGDRCTACGCCIELKTSVKTAICGLVDLGKTPLWNAIEVVSAEGISLTTMSAPVILRNKEFLVDFGSSAEPVHRFELTISGDKKLTFSKWSVSCGCTHVDNVEKASGKSFNVKGSMSTVGFRAGLSEKVLTIEVKDANGRFKVISVRFRVIKEKAEL